MYADQRYARYLATLPVRETKHRAITPPEPAYLLQDHAKGLHGLAANLFKPTLTDLKADHDSHTMMINMGSPDLRLEHPDVSIWQAAAKGDLDTLRYYIDHNETDLAVLLNTRDPETECTLLHLVISSVSDPYPMLRLLLEHGAEPIARNVYNVYPIQLLSLHCSDPLPSMKLLLEYEADPNARDGDGWTPLHYAARFCRDPQPVMQLLVQHGADINAKDASQRSPIFLLLANGDHATALNWLVHDAKIDLAVKADFLDPQTRRTYVGTVILQAAKYARLRCLQFFVDSPATMSSLRTVLTVEEVFQAMTFVRKHQACLATKAARHNTHTASRKLVEMGQTLEKLLNAISVQEELPTESLPGSALRRLGSLRRKPSQSQFGSQSRIPMDNARSNHDRQRMEGENDGIGQSLERRPSLLRRMGSILARQRPVDKQQTIA